MNKRKPSRTAQSPQANLEELRLKAERRRVVTETLGKKSPEEVQRLVEELQVHQIELEMQCEELLQAQAETQRVRAQYVDLYDFAPVGYCTLDAQGRIMQLNLRASQLLGSVRQQLQDRRFSLFVALTNRDLFYGFMQRVLHSEERQVCELEMQRSNGTTFYALLEGMPIIDEQPRVRLVIMDNTAQRKTAEDLRASEAKFRTLFEHSADASVLVLDGHYIDCNQAAVRLLGAHDKFQLIGQSVLLNTPAAQPDGRTSRLLIKHYMEVAIAGGSCQFEWVRHTFAGEALWLEITLTPIEVNGQLLVHSTWRNISDRKRAEAALKDSEARFRTLFEQSSDGTLLLQEGRYIACNAAALRMVGAQRPEDIVGQPATVCAPAVQPDGQESAAWFAENVQRAQQEGSLRFEAQMNHFAGHQIWLEAVLTPVDIPGQATLTHVVWRDVTERRRDVQRLRESEDRLRSALRSAKLGVVSWDMQAREVFLDERARDIFCLPAESPIALSQLADATHPDDRAMVDEKLLRAWREGTPLDFAERITWPNGAVRDLRVMGQLTRDEQDQPIRITAVIRDVTERRRDRQRLLDSEERLRLALLAAGAGVWEVDLTTNELQWDERTQTIFGRPFLDKPVPFAAFTDAIIPADLEGVQAALSASMQLNTPFELEYRIVWPDGSVRYLSATGQTVLNAKQQPVRFVGLVRDITAGHEAQQELNYQTRLMDRVVHNMPVVLTRIAQDGTLLEVVGAGLAPFAVPDNALAGRNVFDAYPMLTEPINRLLAGEEIHFLGMPPKRDRQLYFQNYGFFDEERQCGIMFAIDVTETQQANAQLRQEKDFSRNLLDTSVDGIVALDTDLRITVLNRVAAETFQLVEAEVVQHPLFEVVPELDLPLYRQVLEQVVQGASLQRYNLLFRERYFDAYFAPLRNTDGSVTGALAVIRDVTERNRLASEATQQQVQREKEVLSAILHTQEDERKRIAEALHNGVGQLLYATKLHLEHKSIDETHRDQAVALLNEAIRTTRTISFELTPSILEDFGLKTALEEICKRIPNQHLRVNLNIKETRKPLPRLLQTAVYRIVQELLNNIMKHAQAQEAFVYVIVSAGMVHVSVEDDGVGFEVKNSTKKREGIGLAGIRNRVGLLGGQLTIQSQPGKGTTVNIELPITSEVAHK
ncbi:PAS domain S-box protein [Hymenobacter koreensis]|uniref:histidine kinase n=1 Tax=Hymenobacter koreensis TaxID=1084523 RepID=A0ABP8IWC0_9BACT